VLTVAARGNTAIVTRAVASAKGSWRQGPLGTPVALATAVVGSGGEVPRRAARRDLRASRATSSLRSRSRRSGRRALPAYL